MPSSNKHCGCQVLMDGLYMYKNYYSSWLCNFAFAKCMSRCEKFVLFLSPKSFCIYYSTFAMIFVLRFVIFFTTVKNSSRRAFFTKNKNAFFCSQHFEHNKNIPKMYFYKGIPLGNTISQCSPSTSIIFFSWIHWQSFHLISKQPSHFSRREFWDSKFPIFGIEKEDYFYNLFRKVKRFFLLS